MKTNHTDITLVLDRSGSMNSVRESTIAGVNRFITDQKAAPGTATFSLHQFDHVFETPVQPSDIQHVALLTAETFVPRGDTALLDAMARAIDEAGRRFASMREADRPAKVIIAFVTDGGENASRQHTRADVFGRIAHQRDKYGWEFVFLGANQDAIAAAAAFGIRATHAMTYAHNAAGATAAFDSLSKNTVSFRCHAKAAMNFEATDYAAQAAVGVPPPVTP